MEKSDPSLLKERGKANHPFPARKEVEKRGPSLLWKASHPFSPRKEVEKSDPSLL